MNDAAVFFIQKFPNVNKPGFNIARTMVPEVGGGVAGVIHELNVVADPHGHVSLG